MVQEIKPRLRFFALSEKSGTRKYQTGLVQLVTPTGQPLAMRIHCSCGACKRNWKISALADSIIKHYPNSQLAKDLA